MKLIKSNDPRLHQVANDVLQREVVGLTIAEMEHIMSAYGRISLAAPQLGVMKRIIVVNVCGFKQTFINPVIVKRYGGQTTRLEGCISYPGQLVPVIRYKRIIVEGYDGDWQPIRRKLKGIPSIVVQHEVDHLDGVTVENHSKGVL